MLATVGARMWARVIIQRNAGLDDWIILAGMVRISRKEEDHVYVN
jgi:hypothetical protein